MAKPENYKQCKLKHVNNCYQVAWIPSRFATVGKEISIKGEKGWIVEKVYNERFSKEIFDGERDYLKQREVSDI